MLRDGGEELGRNSDVRVVSQAMHAVTLGYTVTY